VGEDVEGDGSILTHVLLQAAVAGIGKTER
jgi:hypothetical protein